MNNIEKFQKMKTIAQLKVELHKRSVATFFDLKKYQPKLPQNWESYLNTAQMGYAIFQQVRPFFKKQD